MAAQQVKAKISNILIQLELFLLQECNYLLLLLCVRYPDNAVLQGI